MGLVRGEVDHAGGKRWPLFSALCSVCGFAVLYSQTDTACCLQQLDEATSMAEFTTHLSGIAPFQRRGNDVWNTALAADMIRRVYKTWPDRPKGSRSTSKRSSSDGRPSKKRRMEEAGAAAVLADEQEAAAAEQQRLARASRLQEIGRQVDEIRCRLGSTTRPASGETKEQCKAAFLNLESLLDEVRWEGGGGVVVAPTLRITLMPSSMPMCTLLSADLRMYGHTPCRLFVLSMAFWPREEQTS